MKSNSTRNSEPHIRKDDIVRIRTKLQLTQEQFAQVLHINVHTLRNWEQGINKPGAATILLLKLLDAHPEILSEIEYILDHPLR